MKVNKKSNNKYKLNNEIAKVKQNWNTFKNINIRFKDNKKIIYELLKINSYAIKLIDEKYINKKMCYIVLNKDGSLLNYLPKKYKYNFKLTLIALKTNVMAHKNIKKKIDLNLSLKLIKINPYVYNFLTEEQKNNTKIIKVMIKNKKRIVDDYYNGDACDYLFKKFFIDDLNKNINNKSKENKLNKL